MTACPSCKPLESSEALLDSVDALIDEISDPDAWLDESWAQEKPPPLSVEPLPPSPLPDDEASPSGKGPEELRGVDDLLMRLEDPDSLFEQPLIQEVAEPKETILEDLPGLDAGPEEAVPPPEAPEAPVEEAPAEPEESPEAPPEEAPPPPRKPRSPRRAPAEGEEAYSKIRRITMVERKRRDTERRMGGKVQCANCNQIYDLAKLPGNVEKCLNCGSKKLLRVGIAQVAELPEYVEEEEEEGVEPEEVLEEEVAEEEEEEEEEEVPMETEEAFASETETLIQRRRGHKDYYAEFQEEENIYADLEVGADGRPEAAAVEEEEKEVSPGGWEKALQGKLEIKKRAEEEAVLKDDYFLGRKVKDYLVLAILGRGGMGTVYKARTEDEKMIALKILPPIFSRDEGKVERFLKEAESASKLDDPNVVRCYDYGQAGDVHYLAMELVEGQSVGDLIKNKRAVKIQESLRIIKEAAKGLRIAHEKGIVHRDIKPDNIMINNSGVIQVADFGLARDTESASSLSGSGEIVGTPYYISPEQIDVQDVDPRADIYSLGATIYHLITGKRPFEGATPMEVLLKHVNEKLVPPVDRNPLIPVPVSRIISKMMEKNREFRYQDCDELISDINLIEEGREPEILLEEETESPKKAPVPVVVRKSRSGWLWVGLWTLLILGGALGVHFAFLPTLDDRAFFPPRETGKTPGDTALEAALDLLATNPEDPMPALEKLRSIAKTFRGTRAGRKARDKLRAVESDLRAQARAWVQVRTDEATSLRENGSLGKAILETRKSPPKAIQGRPELETLDTLATRIAAELLKKQGMILIPAGKVVDRRGGEERISVRPFLIDVTEVTNRQYLEFVKAKGARAPWPDGVIPEGAEDFPVTGVDHSEAAAYAKFRAKRLPTDREWELAAAGEEGRPFPWGPTFDAKRVRSRASMETGPVAVTALPEGRTPLGLYHMAGNVSEWTSTAFGEENGFIVVRGGGWGSHPHNVRTDMRARVEASTRDDSLGFRLVQDP
ncbi:MAG: bifunctional serine/threonine-protein kinase/formylglycine-generating enzyme family protein [Planctomycetota bacterium]|jgi:serine/threonine-protein kinase